MNRLLFTLICSMGLFLPECLAADEGYDEVVRPFLKKHCIECHGDAEGEADVDLSGTVGDITNATQANHWLKVLNQLQAGLMPPLEEKRPDSQQRSEVARWIESRVISSGHGEAHRRKMLLPAFGNYVDHDLLFSGKITEPPYTPSRIWRTSPYIFAAKRSVSKRVKGVQNPYTFSTPATGIRDYADTSNVDGSIVETIVLNAAAEIEHQFAEAKQLLKNPPKDQRRPNLFVPFVKANTTITDEQMSSIVTSTFNRVVSRNPSEAENAKYVAFLKKNLRETADPHRSLKATLTAIYLSPESLYRMEWGLGPSDKHGRRLLSPDEIAHSLSYALFDNGPGMGGRNESEKVLLLALQEGRLRTREDVAKTLHQMLSTEQFKPIGGQATNASPRVMRFFHEFFGFDKATNVFKDSQRVREHGLYHNPRRLVVDANNLIKVILREDKHVFERLLTTDEVLIFHNGDNQAQIDRHNATLAKLKSYDEETVKQEIAKRKAGVLKKPKFKANPKLVAAAHASIERDGKTLLARMRAQYALALKQGVTMQSVKSRDYSYIRAYNLDTRTWKWPAKQPFSLPKSERAGLLTHPAWLVAHSVNDDNDPIHRGIWVYERLLAGVISDVPPDVDARVPENPHKTLRQRLSGLREGECWKCHHKINPLGEPFEMFDDFGRFRSIHYFDENKNLITRHFDIAPTPEGDDTVQERIDRDQLVAAGTFTTQSVNAAGSFDSLGIKELSGKFDNAIEMIHAIAKTDRARQSIIRHMFRYFMGRNEMLSDSKTLIEADRAYLDSNGSFKAVVVSLLSSESFLYRR